nr:MAG TPA: hypothetical protein [Caudoviricetes sp.]
MVRSRSVVGLRGRFFVYVNIIHNIFCIVNSKMQNILCIMVRILLYFICAHSE